MPHPREIVKMDSNLKKKKLLLQCVLYNQEKNNKRNIFNIDFLKFIFIKIQSIIYQIKHNWMNFVMVKTISKNILR